jgi:hypothetical protein
MLVISKGFVPSVMCIHSIRHSATLGAEAVRGMTSDHCTSAIPECPAHYLPFPHKVVVLDYDHNAVLNTAPSSVLKLSVDWPTSKNIDTILMDGSDNIEEQQPPVDEDGDNELQREDKERKMKLNS